MNDDRKQLKSEWASRPLCTSYTSVVFMTQRMTIQSIHGPRPLSFQWAFGSVDEGQIEILGCWSQVASDATDWSAIGADLNHRGVKWIGEALTRNADDGGAAPVDVVPICGAGGLPRLIGKSPRRYARLRACAARSVDAALDLQKALAVAVRRHGLFVCAESAQAFVGHELERLDKQLWAYRRDPPRRSAVSLRSLPAQVPA